MGCAAIFPYELATAAPITGWRGELSLLYAIRGHRTVPIRRAHYGPLRVQKALYPEAEVCHHIIIHPPAGMAGGDTLALTAGLEDNAAVLLTTPGAAKWYRAPCAPAQQSLHLKLAPGASLEWLPQENIYFNATNVDSMIDVDLDQGAHFIGWDIGCFGRRAGNEPFSAGKVLNRFVIRNGQRLIWQERAVLNAADRVFVSPIGLARKHVCGVWAAAGERVGKALLDAARGVAAPDGAALTLLPHVLLARYLGDSAETAQNYFRAVWRLVRPKLLGRPAVAPRIWST